jgi:hypothetical protein
LGGFIEAGMGRRKTVIGCTTLLVAMSVVCIWSGLFSTVVTWVNCHRVKIGMSLSEVESIFGRGEKEPGAPGGTKGAVVQGDDIYRWYANGVEMYVGLSDGRVCDRAILFIDYP